MGITVHSPFSGEPVKIRDQDVGRAVRDEENRIFYVLPHSSGTGYYGAPTRAGGPRDEQKYDELMAKMGQTRDNVEAEQGQHVQAVGARRRNSIRGKLVILFLAAVVLALVWAFTIGPFKNYRTSWTNPPPDLQHHSSP